MKKFNGTCPRCGDTKIGFKAQGFGGGGVQAGRIEKNGSEKCLTCQSVIGVRRSG
tara:strand:- start:2237 stop:2401 length:165 start_codon:yes stop_codon:yes gene_type:complete